MRKPVDASGDHEVLVTVPWRTGGMEFTEPHHEENGCSVDLYVW